jgi:hypothetical protein
VIIERGLAETANTRPAVAAGAYRAPLALVVRVDHSTASSAVIMKSLSGQEWPAERKATERTKETNNGDSYEYSDGDEGF